jgi:preprotein translocase subunit SecG
MYTFLLVLMILTSIVVILAVLLQSGKGQGLAASFGGASSSPDAFIGMRQAGNLLTKISWWGSGVFLFLAFVLQLMSSRVSAPKSVLEQKLATPAQQQTAPSAPSKAAPAIPLSPATGTTDSASPTTPKP